MTILLAFDSFKGCLTSAQANQAAAEAITPSISGNIGKRVMSDGGDGMLEAFAAALNADRMEVEAHDPLMRPIRAEIAITPDHHTAVIEMARASGLSLLSEDERNPWNASSYGTGELIRHALERGCRHIIIGLGGSATSDAGIGILQALSLLPTEQPDNSKPSSPSHLPAPPPWENRSGITLTIASDVDAPLCGPRGAAHVFARQKGTKTEEEIERLDQRALQFAKQIHQHTGIDLSNHPGAGAAGGCGFALLALQALTHGKIQARITPGAELLFELQGLDNYLRDCDLVITGEGSSDRQTLMGKLPYRLLQHAQAHNCPVWLLSGQIHDREALLSAGFSRVESINTPSTPLDQAMNPTIAARNITTTLASLLHSSVDE